MPGKTKGSGRARPRGPPTASACGERSRPPLSCATAGIAVTTSRARAGSILRGMARILPEALRGGCPHGGPAAVAHATAMAGSIVEIEVEAVGAQAQPPGFAL